MVARLNKLADEHLYTGRRPPHAGKWRNPSSLFQLADGGAVSDRDFLSLWRGFAPVDGWPLSRRARTRTHSPGFEFVLSPDKSISALWAISPEFDRKRIERAVMDAARIALTGTVFRHCAVTRAGRTATEIRIEPGNILAAAFPYHVSRELDPQLDVSCVVFNVVQTHRDPLKYIPSFWSMVAHGRGMFSDRVDPREIGTHWLAKTCRLVERTASTREAADPHRFVDISYYDLVNDPMAQLGKIYERASIPFAADALRAAEQTASRNVQHRYGRHIYDAERFGITREVIEDCMASYRRRQDIPYE